MAWAAPTASAAVTASFDSTTGALTVTGSSGDDTITIRQDAGTIKITDQDGPVTISGGTPTTSNTQSLIVHAGDGKDTIDVNSDVVAGGASEGSGQQPEIEMLLDGGGNDGDLLILNGTPQIDRIVGGADGLNVDNDSDGDDVVIVEIELVQVLGEGGADIVSMNGGSGTGSPVFFPYQVYGGIGEDTLTRGAAAGDLNGQAGNDTLVFNRKPAVTYSDGARFDGGDDSDTILVITNEGAEIHLDAQTLSELVTASLVRIEQADVEYGIAANRLDARAWPGPLLVNAGGGNDQIRINGGVAFGGEGDDFLLALGVANLIGNGGNDTLDALNGVFNRLGGDAGRDVAFLDAPLDQLLDQIEEVHSSRGTAAGGATTQVTSPGQVLVFDRLFALRELQRLGFNFTPRGLSTVFQAQFPGVFDVRVFQLPAVQSQSNGARARRKRRRARLIGTARRKFTAPGTATIKVRLTRRGRRLVRARRRLRVRIRASFTPTAGQKVAVSRRLTLRRKRR